MAKINLFQSFHAYNLLVTGFACILLPSIGLSQNSVQPKKGKPVIYNGVGLDVLQTKQLILGGNHVAYRKQGFGVSWRINFPEIRDGFKEQAYNVTIENAYANNWQTGRQREIYLLNMNLNYVIALTKKIPFYVGMGVANRLIISEFQPSFLPPNETIWIEERSYQNLKLNVGCGVFIPIYNRLILNVGYDYRPQTLFVGIAISGPFNYEDLDMW